MALDTAEIRDLTREILYGTGLGEKPTLRISSGTAAVTGKLVDFTIDDGSKLRPGDVLSQYGSTSTADAYSFYVTSISTNDLTCINGYEGASIANGASMAGMVLEVMPLVGEWKMFECIDIAVGRFLWPEVFDMETDTVTPDLSTGQVAVDARDEEILSAWQKIGSQTYPVSFHLEKKMSTALFASGNMGSFDFIDASTLYYAAKRRISTANSTSSAALNNLIAVCAAAISLGGTQVETSLDSSKKDSQERGKRDVASSLWRDFMVQKQVFSEDLSRDTVISIIVERA